MELREVNRFFARAVSICLGLTALVVIGTYIWHVPWLRDLAEFQRNYKVQTCQITDVTSHSSSRDWAAVDCKAPLSKELRLELPTSKSSGFPQNITSHYSSNSELSRPASEWLRKYELGTSDPLRRFPVYYSPNLRFASLEKPTAAWTETQWEAREFQITRFFFIFMLGLFGVLFCAYLHTARYATGVQVEAEILDESTWSSPSWRRTYYIQFTYQGEVFQRALTCYCGPRYYRGQRLQVMLVNGRTNRIAVW